MINRSVSLTSNQSGKMQVSSMILLVLVAAGVYYGLQFGGVYWRRYTVTDAVEGQLALAGQIADETIRAQIVAEIQKKKHLPPAASRVRLVRIPPRTIEVSISYTETVNLLYAKKQIPVSIKERRTY
jgi:hypothetical protein